MEYILLGGYTATILGLAWWYSRHNTHEDFVIAGRNRPMWQILLSKTAAAIGVGFFLIYTGYGYQFGWPITLLLVFQIISALVFAYWAVPKIYRYAREKQFLTMGDYCGSQLQSPRAGAVMDFLTTLAGFIWVGAGFIGGIKVVSEILSLTYEQALMVSLVIVGTYIILSGYRAVLATDVVQVIVILALLIIVSGSLIQSVDFASVVATAAEPLPIPLIVGIVIFGFFTIFGMADRYQLIYSAKSERAAQQGLLWSVLPFSLAFIPLVFIGLFMRQTAPGLDGDLVFITFLTEHSTESLAAIAGVMLVAGLMSTVDTWVYATASHSYQAWQRWHLRETSLSITTLRYLILIVLAVMGIFSYLFRDLLEVAIFSAATLIAFSTAMLYVISDGTVVSRFYTTIATSFIGLLGGSIVLGIIPELVIIPLLTGALGLLIPVRLLDRLDGGTNT